MKTAGPAAFLFKVGSRANLSMANGGNPESSARASVDEQKSEGQYRFSLLVLCHMRPKNAKRGAFLNSEFELGSTSANFYKHQKS